MNGRIFPYRQTDVLVLAMAAAPLLLRKQRDPDGQPYRVCGGLERWTSQRGRPLTTGAFRIVLRSRGSKTAIEGLLARRAALDERLSLLAAEPDHRRTVARLRCFRGIETLSALALHLEIGDFGRFQRPGQLADGLGLVPSLHQSGESGTRGSIANTGSSYAHRILVEAAWHYLREPRIGVTLRDRQVGQPDHVLQIAWRA